MVYSSPSRSRRVTPLLAIAAALAVAGCTSTTTSSPQQQVAAPALPTCADVFKPGQKIDQAKAAGGCLDPDGGVVGVGAHRCNDSRHLWQVDASTGAVEGWGFGDDLYHAGKAVTDPGYGKAYDACMS